MLSQLQLSCINSCSVDMKFLEESFKYFQVSLPKYCTHIITVQGTETVISF